MQNNRRLSKETKTKNSFLTKRNSLMMKEKLPKNFISASEEKSTLECSVPSPYFRKSIFVNSGIKSAKMRVTGLGFYKFWLNGADLTRGFLSPYITNPDDVLYYDEYDLTASLTVGKNVLAFQLGNGMQNAFGGFVWDFDKAEFRSSPKLAVGIYLEYEDGSEEFIESDESFLWHYSPLIRDDLRLGEIYDARLEIPEWNSLDFDDSDWEKAITVKAPKGKAVISCAEPIAENHVLSPVSVRRGEWQPAISGARHTGYIYDFGENNSGIIRLKIRGESGQRISITFGEMLLNGDFYTDNISFIRNEYKHLPDYVQQDVYICRGDGIEYYQPTFTYHGFRYAFVEGITEEQATEDLLKFSVMSTKLGEIGSFTSSCRMLNTLQEMTRRATLSNFFHFPTDCPHREKNGWTADAALSAEHTLLNLNPYNNYYEWMRSVGAALDERGALPGIVPTAGWGFAWGNGPAWDQAIVEIPYLSYRYTGRKEIIEDNIDAIIKYTRYLIGRRDSRGLIAIGLGDWCAPTETIKAPLEVTDSIISMSIFEKAAFMCGLCGRSHDSEAFGKAAAEMRNAIRDNLLNTDSMTLSGDCQSSQAMGLYYNIFEPSERERARDALLLFIKAQDNRIDTGVLGGRVLFHVLSELGFADLAYDIITGKIPPSYGCWLDNGYTTLAEDFFSDDEQINSKNHHFWGDISAFFIKDIVGINYNPNSDDISYMEIKPHFIKALDFAKAHFDSPVGRISVEWQREGKRVKLSVTVPGGMSYNLIHSKEFKDILYTNDSTIVYYFDE